jgi:uncharacterized protein (DUF885 family)
MGRGIGQGGEFHAAEHCSNVALRRGSAQAIFGCYDRRPVKVRKFKDRDTGRWLGFALGLLVTTVSTAHPAQGSPSPDAAVTQLADSFVDEYKLRFPFAVMEAGLELKSQSGININAPVDLARWRRFVRSVEIELNLIPESAVAGTPAWVTHAFLRQAIAQQRSYEVCRWELWNISPYEWAFRLRAIAETQPVATARDRREALKRWEGLGAWIDQDAANLAAGLRLGYGALGGAVEAEIRQIDALIAAPPDQWPTATLAKRASNPEFTRHLSQIRTRRLLPAAKRYRDFLTKDYVPKARLKPPITSQPLGTQCLQSRLSVSTTVDMDPKTMFETLVVRREAEHARMLELGARVYGVTGLDWPGLVQRVLSDPRSRFRDAADIRSTLEQVMARARAALPRMLMNAPSGEITLNPFPAYAEATSPAGQFFRASDDGSRPAMFSYRANPLRFSRVTAESLTMHETIPGHYLQTAFLAGGSGTRLHAVSRLVYAEGPSEGWATYAESWASELALYSSELDEMGGFMNSVTPSAVADLGMQAMGWNTDEAVAYLAAESPFWTEARARDAVNGLASSPAEVEAYPIGALQYEAARKSAQEILGSRFDSREFHQMLLSEGALPFAALNSKVARWVAAHR